MKSITLPAHFDGEQIQLDEPFALEPEARLLVTVLPSEEEGEEESWADLSAQGLAGAYGPEEPEYSLDLLTQKNAEYERG